MSRPALKASDLPERIAARAAAAVVAGRVAVIKGKKLKDLTAKQKDLLLKELAIRAGLLVDDGED
jgi:hypothetical protein